MENFPKQFVLSVAISEIAVHFPGVDLDQFSSLPLLRMISGRLKRPRPPWNDWVMQTNQSCRNIICNTGERIAGDETTKASYKKNRFEAIARIAADQCYRNAAALRAWSVRLLLTLDPGFVRRANRPGNKGWQTGQPEGPTVRGWIGSAVGRREKRKCVGRRHASTTGGSDRSQVTLGWMISAVEGGV